MCDRGWRKGERGLKCVAEVGGSVPECEAWSVWQRLEEGCRKARHEVCGRGWQKGAGKRGLECEAEVGGRVPESEAWSVCRNVRLGVCAEMCVCGRGWKKGAGKRGLECAAEGGGRMPESEA